MSPPSNKRSAKGGKKKRVAFRRNRSRPPRPNDWTNQARDAEDHEVDSNHSESVVAKGALSRRRTIIVHDEGDQSHDGLSRGTVVAMRGLYADVDDGESVVPCTVRRVLRTRLTGERHQTEVVADAAGVLHQLLDRHAVLRSRNVGKVLAHRIVDRKLASLL